MTFTAYTTAINLIDTDEGVRVERVLSNGDRTMVPWLAPDRATAWKWGEPLIGCLVYTK